MKGACRIQLVALMYWSKCRGNINKDKFKPATVLESCRESKPPFPGLAMGSTAAHAQAFTGIRPCPTLLAGAKVLHDHVLVLLVRISFSEHKIPDDHVLVPAHHVDVTGQ